MKIYTKTGDRGQTSLVGGERVSKCCERLESYGTVDELNSLIGLLACKCADAADRQFLTDVQNRLFVVGGYLATDSDRHDVSQGNVVTERMVALIETEIDRLQETVPPLRQFIVPGGTEASALAHVCRTVCRRAERQILRLAETGAAVAPEVTAYVNRLSDYFFVLARKMNADAGVSDLAWKRTEAD